MPSPQSWMVSEVFSQTSHHSGWTYIVHWPAVILSLVLPSHYASQCKLVTTANYKESLDEIFVISRRIKVEVGVLLLRPWFFWISQKLNPIIILFYYTLNKLFLSCFNIKCFQSLCQLFLFLRFRFFSSDRKSRRDRSGRFCDIYCAVILRYSYAVTFCGAVVLKVMDQKTLVKHRGGYKVRLTVQGCH